MNYIQKLLNGEKVEWKTLGEVAKLSNTGIDKKIKEDEEKVRLLNFVDVFRNQYIDNNTPTMVVSASDKKIKDCNILKEDIFITPSSEIIDEIGFSAMATEDFENAVYSYHIMRIRIKDKNLLYPKYLNYLFQSDDVRKQIKSKAQGITRFGLTQPKWLSIKIPIPPLPVQQKIAEILDRFAELEAELEAELHLREKQYNYYRNHLLTPNEQGLLNGKKVEWKSLGEVVPPKRGKRLVKNQLLENAKYPVFQNSLQPLGYFNENNCRSYMTFVISAGAAGEIGFSDIDFWACDDCYYFDCPKGLLNDKYLYYFLKTQQHQIFSQVRKASIPRISRNIIEKLKIPIPPIEEQERIVKILDTFDALVNSISEGLPKEIALRRKQYEYYREQLLSFPEN